MLAVIALLAFSLIRDRVSRDALTKSMTALVAEMSSRPADRFFARQTPERSVLENASRSVCLIQETGNLIAEQCHDEIIRVLNSNGSVKFVVCLPADRPTLTLAFRNENLDTASAISNRLDGFHNQIRSIKRAIGAAAQNLEVRYTPYDVGFTLVLSKATTSVGEHQLGLVRLAGFRIPYGRKIDFTFDSRSSPLMSSHFTDEFNELFESSTKFVLLTGEPRVGKTSLFAELLAIDNDQIFYVISVAKCENGARVAFSVRSSLDPREETVFARKDTSLGYPDRDVRQYSIEAEVWDDLASKIRQARLRKQIIVIDEIGEMQLKSSEFCSAVRELLSDPEAIVFATVPIDERRHPLLREIGEHHRTTVYRMTPENQTSIARTLKSELDNAFRLREYMSK